MLRLRSTHHSIAPFEIVLVFLSTAFLIACQSSHTGTSHPALLKPTQPNVILVMTDDQGYGDIGAHGNPILKTPKLDNLHATSVRLTNFHVVLRNEPRFLCKNAPRNSQIFRAWAQLSRPAKSPSKTLATP